MDKFTVKLIKTKEVNEDYTRKIYRVYVKGNETATDQNIKYLKPDEIAFIKDNFETKFSNDDVGTIQGRNIYRTSTLYNGSGEEIDHHNEYNQYIESQGFTADKFDNFFYIDISVLHHN